jgi:maleylpyruvate isomerase
VQDRHAALADLDTVTERLLTAAIRLRVRATDADIDIRLGDGPDISGPGRELLGWLTSPTSGTILSITRGAALPAPPPWPQGPATGRRQA